MQRTKLVAARARKGWTLEVASEQIGCAPNTLSRWELGIMTPSSYNRGRLCAVYKMTVEELGLAEDVTIIPTDLSEFPDNLQAFLNADLTMRLMALVFTPHRNRRALRHVLSRTIEEFTMNTGHEAALTRREALQRLVMLPVLLSASRHVQWHTEDALTQYAAGTTACWHLSFGNHEDMSLAFSMLSAYLPALKAIVRDSASYRKEAAGLTAECALLQTILGWHLKSLDKAMSSAQNALTYSEAASDLPLQIAIHRQLSWLHYYGRRDKKALEEAEQAVYLLEQSHVPLPPHLASSAYSALANRQAMYGQRQSAITSLRKAHQTLLTSPTTSGKPIYVDHDHPNLMLEVGMTYARLGLHEAALESFEQLVDPETFAAKMPLAKRVWIEALNNQIMSLLKIAQRDMEQAIKIWKMGIQGAIALQSEQRFAEACLTYDMMESVWPGEERITELRELIKHW